MINKVNENIKKYIEITASATTKKLIIDNCKNENYTEKRMQRHLKFSTGGIRALMGIGISYMNDVTVNIIGTALAKHFYDENSSNMIFIGYDGRHNSTLFAFILANIFNRHGYNVMTHVKPVITPFVSFVAKEQGMGIMVTASHNGKEYNGIKVFLNDGCQVSAPNDREIEDKIKTMDFTEIDMKGLEYKDGSSVIVAVEKLPFLLYFDFIFFIRKYSSFFINGWGTVTLPPGKTKVLFSALFGPSAIFLKTMAETYGVSLNIIFYEPHSIIDPNFGGIEFPNPEKAEVFRDPIKFAEANDIFTIMMVDPDGDRFALAQRNHKSYEQKEWYFYNADEIATIFIYNLLSTIRPVNLAFINTFYCSKMIKEIAAKNEIEYHQTETGFKNISKKANNIRKTTNKFLLAYEDALGFMIGNSCEKDGITCVIFMVKIMIVEKCLTKIIREMQSKYGCYISVTEHFRVDEPLLMLNKIVHKLKTKYECIDGGNAYEVNGLEFEMLLRISGTESIIKVYAKGKDITRDQIKKRIGELVGKIIEEN